MSSSGMTVQALGSGTIVLHDHQQNKHAIHVVYVPKAEFPILSMFKLHLDIRFSNDAIHLSNHRTGFSLQSVIRSDDIPWVSEGTYRQSWHSVGPEPIPDSNRTDKLRVSVGSVPPFLDSRSVRYLHSVGTQGH